MSGNRDQLDGFEEDDVLEEDDQEHDGTGDLGQLWDGTLVTSGYSEADLWTVRDVGMLSAQLDQLDELAGRWLTGEAGAGVGSAGLGPAAVPLDDEAPPDDPDHDATDGGSAAQDDAAEAESGEQDLPIVLKYKLRYPDVYSWYGKWFRRHYRRHVNGHKRVWSGAWYEIPEAYQRMESMWRAWESLRQDPETGGSRWFLHHADEHMKVLMDPDGPLGHLQDSDKDHTKVTQFLAWRPPPGREDTLQDDEESAEQHSPR